VLNADRFCLATKKHQNHLQVVFSFSD